jgi:hypothetical protein
MSELIMQMPLFSLGRGFKALAIACLLGLSLQAHASSLLVDDFSAPSPPATGNPTGTGAQFFERTFGTFAGATSQVRESNYNLYRDPDGSGAQVSVGEGAAKVNAGAGALGELVAAYGGFTRPTGDPLVGGPRMGLDLRGYDDLRAEFSGVGAALNVVAVLYTSAPLLQPDGSPLYYLTTALNAAPASPDGDMTVDLLLDARNVFASNSAFFNFAQVDGIVFLVDRSGSALGNHYQLDSLQFTQAVPEPASLWLLLTGLGLGGLGALQRRPWVRMRG